MFSQTPELDVIIISFYRWGNWDPEWFSNLKVSKITELMNGGIRILTQAI